jgi:hypothetical protein
MAFFVPDRSLESVMSAESFSGSCLARLISAPLDEPESFLFSAIVVFI